MKMEMLVDAPAFWARLQEDILSARERVYVQTLSLEGDSAGLALSGALLARPVPDRRILCDSFTQYMHNDRFLYSPLNLLDSALRSEACETKAMIQRLNDGGVPVKFTNPVGPFLVKFPARNHRKIILVDSRVAYIGGINFSEHNFSWHDLMLRIEDEEVTEFLAGDFLATWAGENQYVSRCFDNLELHLLDGHKNPVAFEELFARIDATRQSIFVESPYLTFPFYERLRAARRRGVRVTIITPEVNNWKLMNAYVAWKSSHSDIAFHLYKERMTHLKAMLLDDEVLVIGSSNFDFLSYRVHQEVLAFITAKEIIADFRARVLDVDFANSKPFPLPTSETFGWFGKLKLKTLEGLVAAFCQL